MTSPVVPAALPLTRLAEPSYFQSILAFTPVKALVPLPILAALAPAVWWFFRDTWRVLDAEAAETRSLAGDRPDYRPAVALVIVAVVLTLQEYYGGRQVYDALLRPWLHELEAAGHPGLKTAEYDELYSYAWWALARIIGYVLIPLPLWKLIFPQDSLLDMGLRGRGFLSHLWIYGLCLSVVLPAMLLVASQPDFGTYYPFYKSSSRSVSDLLMWEAMYGAQFFALELFFRGFLLGALRRTLGSAAIFAMAVPYCMIHYGKPYLETNGAIVAGIVLGSLAMRTRSIYAGFLVHITVAFSMDFLALWRRDALPHVFWPSG
jgi:membrane protease YdiL (CAAX protease family)